MGTARLKANNGAASIPIDWTPGVDIAYVCKVTGSPKAMMRFSETRTTILQLASEMARSGRYRGWRTIEAHLRADGLTHVREVLDDADVRAKLDHYCRRARSSA